MKHKQEYRMTGGILRKTKIINFGNLKLALSSNKIPDFSDSHKFAGKILI